MNLDNELNPEINMPNDLPIYCYPQARRIGLIADTHVPDRAKQLHPLVFDTFDGVDLILHGGDITSKGVMDQLNEIAPTLAVRGNNRHDALIEPPLPYQCMVQVSNGIRIAMWHGMETFSHRLTDAILGRAGFFKFISNRMIKRSINALPDSDIIFFGHLHWPKIHYTGTRLLINPGRAFSKTESSCGILLIDKKTVRVKIIPLANSGRLSSLVQDWHVFCLHQKMT
jgi:putative phosphoesterase